MAYLQLEFPRRIALGAQRKSDWATSVNRTYGGWTQRNQNRAAALHSWDIGLAIRTAADFAEVLAHFHECRGQVHSFPFVDPLDHQATAEQGTTTLVTGTTYQLLKRYGSANPYLRRITRPQAGTVRIFRTRAGATSEIFPSVDTGIGRFSPAGHQSGDTYSWSGQFYVPARYAADGLPGILVDRAPNGGEYLVDVDSILVEEDPE
jgi:uncharacterized protein (TIGR02217 family)